jgi:hypothetical protein
VPVELAILGGLVWAWRSGSRLERERRPACRSAANAIQAHRVVPAVVALYRAVETQSREAVLTPDGVIPAESFEDALARQRYVSEFDAISDAVREKLEPPRRLTRCKRRASRLRDALAAFALAVPAALWPEMTETGVPDWLQAVLAGVVGLCGLAVAGAFVIYASAENDFERCVSASEELA